ncbi:MAG: hypothetical protein AAFO74_02195 [Pseudomonadota bacterium]
MLRATAFALTMIGVFSVPAHAANLKANQIVELANVELAADGTESVTYSPATDVEPGEQIRYSLVYANQGADAAENVSLVMPVPSEVTYVEASVDGASSNVFFSADEGQTFAPRDQVTIDDGVNVRLATSAEITHIKWDFAEPIAPAATGAVRYNAVLN